MSQFETESYEFQDREALEDALAGEYGLDAQIEAEDLVESADFEDGEYDEDAAVEDELARLQQAAAEIERDVGRRLSSKELDGLANDATRAGVTDNFAQRHIEKLKDRGELKNPEERQALMAEYYEEEKAKERDQEEAWGGEPLGAE